MNENPAYVDGEQLRQEAELSVQENAHIAAVSLLWLAFLILLVVSPAIVIGVWRWAL